MTSTPLRAPSASEAWPAPLEAPAPVIPAASRESLGQCRLAAPLLSRAEVCRHCGGSGMLRVSDLSYRTCMDCLGLGKLTLAPTPTAVWTLSDVSGSACASGAR